MYMLHDKLIFLYNECFILYEWMYKQFFQKQTKKKKKRLINL